MARTLRLGVIGGGNMGSAILRGGIERGVLAAAEIIVAEPDPDRRSALEALGCRVTDRAADVLDAEQLLLAVKPQVFPAVADETGALARPTIVISVMAGLSSDAILDRLGPHARVVRVMPNTPCQVGCGMAAVARGTGSEPGDDALAAELLGAIGRTVTVDESLMDAVTAVSGSGPGYLFLLAEAMIRGATEVDLPDEVASLLVMQTILGAGRLLEAELERGADGKSPAALREAVTSPAGTTAAGLAVLNEAGLVETFARAIRAARDRGRELGGDKAGS